MNQELKEDSRKHERIHTPAGMWISWTVDSRTLISRVRDISVGGVFILTPNPVPLESTVKLLFSVQEGEIRASGTVRCSVQGEGMGIEFTGMGNRDMTRLQNLVERLLPLEGR